MPVSNFLKEFRKDPMKIYYHKQCNIQLVWNS